LQPSDRRRRAVALVDGDFEAFLFEVTLVLGDEEPALRALILQFNTSLSLVCALAGVASGAASAIAPANASKENGG